MKTNKVTIELTHSEIIQTLVALQSYVIYWEKKGIEMDATKELVMKFMKIDEDVTNSPI